MKRLSLLLLSFAMLFAAAQARKRTFRMADYGVTPGTENQSETLQKALADIKAQVQVSADERLGGKEGRSRCQPQHAKERN